MNLKTYFNETRRFWIVEIIVFIALLSITLLEVARFGRYEELFRKYQLHLSWFFGITFGIFFSDIKSKVKKKIDYAMRDRLKFKFERDVSFPLFLGKVLVIVFLSAVVIGLAKSYLIKLFIFAPLIMAQWLIILYIWYKFENKVKPSLKYILTNEIILVINLIILLLAFII